MKPITLFHFQYILQNAKQFWSLKRSHHYGNFMGCHHGTGRAQCWHLAVTCNVRIVIVKTIVIVTDLSYQSTQKCSRGFVIYTGDENDTARIIWLVLDAISCVKWPIYRSHRRRDHGSNFLTGVTYSSQSNSNCTYWKIIMDRTPQSNLPILKRFRSFKIPAIPLIWPKSPHKHSVTRSYRSGKESGQAVGIAIVTSSMTFLCLYI